MLHHVAVEHAQNILASDELSWQAEYVQAWLIDCARVIDPRRRHFDGR